MELIKRFFKDLLTGQSGEHYELARVGLFLALISAITFQAIALAVKNQAWSMTDFGTGMGIILAGGGGAALLKDLGNPKNRASTVIVPPGGDANVAGDANVQHAETVIER